MYRYSAKEYCLPPVLVCQGPGAAGHKCGKRLNHGLFGAFFDDILNAQWKWFRRVLAHANNLGLIELDEAVRKGGLA